MGLSQLIATIGGDSSGLRREVNKSKGMVRELEGAFTNAFSNRLAGVIGIGALIEASRRTVEYAGKINDLSQRLGIGTEALQEFDFAATQNGANLEKMTAFIERLNVSRQDALNGNKDLNAAFKELGVTIDDLKGKRVQDLTKQIANKVKDSDIQAIIAPLREVGGKGAGDLVAAFKAGLADAGDQARKSGQIISDSTIQQLDEIGDRFDSLGGQLRAGLAPAIGLVMDAVQAIIDSIRIGGAYLGAVTANLDISKILKSLFNPLSGGPIVEISKQLGEGSIEADKAVSEIKQEIVKREEQLIKNRVARAQVSDAAATGTFEKTREENKAPKRAQESNNLNELQRVGAFITNPNRNMEQLSRQQIDLLKVVAQNTRPRPVSPGKTIYKA